MSNTTTRISFVALALAALSSIGCGDDGLGDDLGDGLDEASDFDELRSLEDGLELHWTFEDRSGNQITDVSGNGRHGTAVGGTFASSPSGEALSLDGVDDYVAFAGPRAPSIYGGVNGAVTVSARVRVADVLKYNTLCYGCGPFNSMYVGTSNYGARAMAAVFNQSTSGLSWPWSNQALTNDTWVEVTMILEGGVGTRFYLGCALDSTVTNASVGLKDYGASSLGSSSIAGRWFQGEVDEFRIWSRALSDTEIAELCAPSIEDGLELHWTFEDRVGTQITDVSGKGRHGTVQGGASFVAGPVGEAISLDGVDDYVSLVGPRAPSIYGGVNGDFTVSSRVRVANVAKDNTLCSGCGPFNSLYVGAAAYPQKLMAAVFNQSTSGLIWPLSTAALSNDTWAEVTMVVEGGVGTRYYLDCAFDSQLANANVGLKDYGYSSVGRGSTASRWFDGEIDELRVWNRALSEAEIAELCPEVTPLEEGLELHWTFEDRVGTTILDVSGNGRDGTLVDGAFVGSPNGDAVSLDGVDDHISFAGAGTVADDYGGPTGDVTISTRLRVADVQRYNALCVGCGPVTAMFVGVATSNGTGNQVMAKVYDGEYQYPTSTLKLKDDTWVEVTMVVDGGVGVRFYLDGVLNSQVLDPNIELLDVESSSVGLSLEPNRMFAGEIDEFRIWSRALSDAEIAQIGGGGLPLDFGLQLHWTFEDRYNNLILDLSGKGRHSGIQGNPNPSYIDSPVGQALHFDGIDDYMAFNAPRSPSLYGGVDGKFTLSTRVRVDDVSVLNTFCFGCGPFNSMYLGNLSGGTRAVGKLFDQVSLGFLWSLSTSALVSDTWVEVTMTVDGTTGARMYIDCALDSELNNPNVGLKDYGGTPTVAKGAGANWFRGDIDELRIWDRILSDAEIAALCQ